MRIKVRCGEKWDRDEMSIFQRSGTWLLISALVGCATPFQTPLPGGDGRIDFGIEESFCVLHLASSSPGAAAALTMNAQYKLLDVSDPQGSMQLTLNTGGTNLPTSVTIFVDDRPVVSRRVRYGNRRKVERDFCWEDDPVTGELEFNVCDVVRWEENKKEGVIRLDRSQRAAIAAAFPDDGQSHMLSFYQKGSHKYLFEFPPEAIAFVGDPQRTCAELRAKARPQAGS